MSKPIEKVIGRNLAVMRFKLGSIHCASSLLTQARHVRPRGLRQAPVALRRGWVQAVIDIRNENLDLFNYVTTGRIK